MILDCFTIAPSPLLWFLPMGSPCPCHRHFKTKKQKEMCHSREGQQEMSCLLDDLHPCPQWTYSSVLDNVGKVAK